MTLVQRIRLYMGRLVYWALWMPAVAVAFPFALVYAMAEVAVPAAAKAIRPAFRAYHAMALSAGNAVFGRDGRAALAKERGYGPTT